MRFVAALVLALVACGDNEIALQLRSGEQLKLGWYEYDGGARELETGWYFDRRLGERCRAIAWSDGKQYCTPTTDEAVYDSETCSSAVGRIPIGHAPAAFFATTFTLTGTSVSEPVFSRLFRRGGARAAPTMIWRRVGTVCLAGEAGSYDYFDLGDEVDVSELVQINRSEPSGDGELAVIYELGTDGLQVPAVLYDRAANTSCTTAAVSNALDVPCVPVTTRVAEAYFLDPVCMDPVVAVLSGERPPLIKLRDAPTNCETYHHLGDLRTVPPNEPVFQRQGATCVQGARIIGARFYELGERTYVPVLGRLREPGANRIHAIARIGDQLELRDPLMYDAQLDIECMHDDELRCVPPVAAGGEAGVQTAFYVDPQCQTPVGIALVPRGACDVPQRFATDGTEYYELLEPYSNPIYVSSKGDCNSYTPPEPLVAYRVSAPVERSTFAQANLVIDP